MMIAHRNIERVGDFQGCNVGVTQKERINAIKLDSRITCVIGLEDKVDHPHRETFPNQVGPFR